MITQAFLRYPGSKYKLVPWIKSIVGNRPIDTWCEPFAGSCVVAMNIKAKRYVLSDLNSTLIDLYQKTKNKTITYSILKEFLYEASNDLRNKGGLYYYDVRNRYNKEKNVLDFVFLNQTGFNGLVRYNKNGNYSTPFCKNCNVLNQKRIDHILHNFNSFYNFVNENDVEFFANPYETTINYAAKHIKNKCLIYCDTPYIDTDVSYLGDKWTYVKEKHLESLLRESNHDFIVSTWNDDRNTNIFLDDIWGKYNLTFKEHDYIIGSTKNRKHINEVLITNFDYKDDKYK